MVTLWNRLESRSGHANPGVQRTATLLGLRQKSVVPQQSSFLCFRILFLVGRCACVVDVPPVFERYHFVGCSQLTTRILRSKLSTSQN